MAKLIITTGLPASGKTTWAIGFLKDKSSGIWLRINWDEDRIACGMTGEFSRRKESEMQEASFKKARGWAAEGGSLLIDNTNLNPKTVNKWLAIGVQYGMEVSIKDFPTSVYECIRRDAARDNPVRRVGRAVIERMALFADLIKFSDSESYIIVDIDGTLADTTERQKHIVSGPCETCKGAGMIFEAVEIVCYDCDGKGVPSNFKK